MIFPIGLGTRLKNRQWGTIVLILVSVIVFLFIQSFSQLNIEIKKIHKNNMETKIVSKLYLEYCIQRVVDRKHCIFSKPFFHLKHKKRVLDKRAEGNFSEVIEDMGNEYQGTKHYMEFYQSLMANSEKINSLPSYREFLDEQTKHLKQAHKIHKEFNALSIGNSSIFVYILAMISSVGMVHLVWNILALVVFGRYVEKRLGTALYIFCFFFIPYLVLNYYIKSLPSDSIQYIVGSTATVSTLIGFFYSFFFHYRLKFLVWKIKGHDFILVRVRYIVPVIYLVQEAVLHYFSPINVPHRAHLFAVILGMALAQILKMRDKLPKGFLFHSELKEWEWLKSKQEDDINLFLNGACNLLGNNPRNISIREDVFKVIKEKVGQGEDIKFYLHYLDGILPFYISQKKNLMKSPEKVLEILALLPVEVSYTKYLVDTKKKNVFRLIQSAKNLNFGEQTIKLVEVYFEKYERGKELGSLEDILREVIEVNYAKEECRGLIYKIAHSSTSIRLRDLCITYIDK
ncbi:MAG: membrane associated rhomboid family serine protease [Bacteriovoracaceae bacterium]|jgi:membrane associated rhomboid family serine protease